VKRLRIFHIFIKDVCRYDIYRLANLSWIRKTSNSSYPKHNSSVFESFFALKAGLQVLKLNFIRLSLGRTTDKLTKKWQNFAQVGLQLKFALRTTRLKVSISTAWKSAESKFAVCSFICQIASARRQRSGLSGLRVKLPPVLPVYHSR